MCTWVHVPEEASKGVSSLELELQAVVSCPASPLAPQLYLLKEQQVLFTAELKC